MKPQLYPLTFTPVYKEKIWGGRVLEELLGRDLPQGLIGESWDVAAHPHGMSVVDQGPLAGRTLEELVRQYGVDLLGLKGINDQGKFPLLLKLIDAKQDLSVQVHPDDEYVRQHGQDTWGKTEMWYIVHSEPEAWIIWGLRPGVTKEGFAEAIEQGGEGIMECLNKVYVKQGELYPISSGLIHALGAGVVVAEIQQNSDTTYRVYDWDRLDDQGQPRELHVEQALEVIDFSVEALDPQYQFSRCEEHFKLNILNQPKALTLELGDGFQILTSLQGVAEIDYNGRIASLSVGQSCLLPANLGRCTLSAEGVVLQSTLP